MPNPVYSFSIPSIHDDTSLDCRIFHPKTEMFSRVAVVAHPYAPLGGTYDDHVVETATRALLKAGWIVGTFNFRGAGDTKAKTSWTGRAERDDFASVVGLMIYYASRLVELRNERTADTTSEPLQIELCLAGYSYGALICSRLSSVPQIQQHFETAVRGTAAAEIILRSRRLAGETVENEQRGRQLVPPVPTSPQPTRLTASPVVVGGEETDPSNRRRSRDASRSAEIVRRTIEMPHRLKQHVRRQSSGAGHDAYSRPSTAGRDKQQPQIVPRYLMISPPLPPLSYALCVPSFEKINDLFACIGDFQILVIFGSNDSFISARRLRSRMEQLSSIEGSRLQWKEIDHADHFWREDGQLKELQKQVCLWLG